MNLVDPDYFLGLGAELSTRSLAEWQSYLRYRIVKSFTGALGAAIIAEEAGFDGNFTGATAPPAPELACLDDTAGLYAFEFSRAFVELLFTTQDREKVRQLFERLRGTFHEQLQQTSTLDAATRAAAVKKLEQVLPQIAFPDEQDWPTTSYPPSPADQNYLSSLLKLADLRTRAEWAKLDQPAERSKFGMAPIIKNALYAPHSNRVIVPAAFLMRPAYDPTRAAVANYATVGTVLGHELSHGFDYEGRYFDGTGRLVDWWSDESAQGYEQRASCLVDQFDAYAPLPGLHVDGSFTLSENIADLNGAQLALAAYKASGARDPELAGFSAEQQFFLSFAQLWCESPSDESLKLTLLTDNHSPAQYRVNGVVRNMPEFAEAFACTPGRALVPEKRCSVF